MLVASWRQQRTDSFRWWFPCHWLSLSHHQVDSTTTTTTPKPMTTMNRYRISGAQNLIAKHSSFHFARRKFKRIHVIPDAVCVVIAKELSHVSHITASTRIRIHIRNQIWIKEMSEVISSSLVVVVVVDKNNSNENCSCRCGMCAIFVSHRLSLFLYHPLCCSLSLLISVIVPQL